MISIITSLPETKLIGMRQTMSFAHNTTPALWKSFMPRRKEINNTVDGNLYSLQNYNAGFFNDFSPLTAFEKWAAVAVPDFNTVPAGMETLTLTGGLYAMFNYKGDAAGADGFFRAIFQEWLPQAGYIVDDRPHFELLGEKYKKGADDSEEEVWIPVKQTAGSR